MRFKPPPPNSDIGWRVEFRPMEVRLGPATGWWHLLVLSHQMVEFIIMRP